MALALAWRDSPLCFWQVEEILNIFITVRNHLRHFSGVSTCIAAVSCLCYAPFLLKLPSTEYWEPLKSSCHLWPVTSWNVGCWLMSANTLGFPNLDLIFRAVIPSIRSTAVYPKGMLFWYRGTPYCHKTYFVIVTAYYSGSSVSVMEFLVWVSGKKTSMFECSREMCYDLI